MDRKSFLKLAAVSTGLLALPRSTRQSRRPVLLPGASAPRPRSSQVRLSELDDRIVLANEVGRLHVWKGITWSADGQRVVGPGYAGRFERHDAALPPLVDDFRAPGAINDPRFGGLGAFGWHHARPDKGEWDIHGRLDATRNGGFGVARSSVIEPPMIAADGTGRAGVRVEFRDGWQDPVMAVTYRYLIQPRLVICLVEVEQLWQDDGHGQAFLKEPKLVAAVAPAYSTVDVYADTGALVRRIAIDKLSEPWQETAQIAERDRARVAFVGSPALGMTVTMQAWDGRRVVPWYGRGAGFDGWAEAAQRRPAYSDSGAGYCLGYRGRLRRRWEVAARTADPALACLFHAWEGGSRYSDCMDASRAFGPAGESWSTVASYRL